MLQFITHQPERFSYLDSVRLALDGGCRWVQLRMKDATARQLHDTAIAARQMCREAGATLIIDDRIDIALAMGADGVHLGQTDLPVAAARSIAPRGFIVGGTANTPAQTLEHFAAGADYVGCGPFRFTSTKRNLSPVLGLEGYRGIVSALPRPLPIVAIGGITAADIPSILATGVGGIAVSGAVLNAPDPVAEMRQLIKLTE